MASITITKPAKWVWDSASIVDTTDATDLVVCEPFWATNDWTLTNAATHSDITGKTLTWNQGAAGFSWVSDANVGACIDRASRNNSAEGLSCATTGISTASGLSAIFVFRDTDAAVNAVRELAGLTNSGSAGLVLCIDNANDTIVIRDGNNTTRYTSTLTVADSEWHCLGVAIDKSTGNISLCLDGGTVETGTLTAGTIPFGDAAQLWYSACSTVASNDKADFAFWALWSAKLSDAKLQDLTDPANGDQGPYRLLTQSSGGATTLTAGTGSFTETGVAATLKAARKISATAASLTLAGQTATLAGPGAKTLTAEAGSFTLTGQDIGLEVAIPTSVGSFTLTGQAATLTYTPFVPNEYTLAAALGIYALTGIAAVMAAPRRISIMGTTQLAPPVNQVWVTYAEDEETRR